MASYIHNYIQSYKIKYYSNQYKKPTNSKNLQNKKNSKRIDEILADQNNSKKILNLGLSTILISSSCLLFTKSVQKNILKYSHKFKNHLEYQFELNSLNSSDKKAKFYKNFVKGLDVFLTKSESINNITSIRDILFMKLMYATKPTRYLHQATTRWFDNLSKSTIAKSYKNIEKSFKNVENRFNELDNFILKNSKDETYTFKGKTYTTKELLDLAKSSRDTIYSTIKIITSPDAQKARQKVIKDENSRLYKTFWKDLKSDKIWNTFIAEAQMKDTKTNIARDISIAMNMISYNEKDKCISLCKILQDFRRSIPFSDNETYNQIKKLEWLTQSPGDFNEFQGLFLKELEKLKQPLNIPNIKPENLQKLEKCKDSYIRLITEILEDNSTGDVQDIIAIYRKLAPFEFVKSGALQSLQNVIRNLNTSINLEISEYFDKVRDLVLGSAPTDVLTILLSTGLITRDLSKAKNKDEKKSIILTSGIPLAGAISTTIIATTKLVSGGKSLALGLVSGIILNVLGKKVDNFRKDFNKH